MGDIAVWTGAALLWVILPIAEAFLPKVKKEFPIAAAQSLRWLVAAHVVCQVAMVFYFIVWCTQPSIPTWMFVGAVISVGSNSGASAMVVAHELMHRTGRWSQLGTYILLLSCNYTHYALEHIHIHHRQVGTRHDPATARASENPYVFVIRCTLGQLYSIWAYAFEKFRAPAELSQRMLLRTLLVALVINLGLLSTIAAAFGPIAFYGFVAQSVVSIFLLNIINYVEHWGLERHPDEKLAARHTWDTDTIVTRLMLFDLGSHSEHHLRAVTPHHGLCTHDKSPKMPIGLFSATVMILCPPLFKWVMRDHLPDHFDKRPESLTAA